MLPPWAWAFPEYHRSICCPFDAHGLLAQAVGGEELAVQDDVTHAVVLGLLQGLVQVWCLGGEHVDDLVEIAVPGGPGDAVVTGQRGDVAAVAEPPQREHCLVEAGQRPAVAASAPGAAFGVQQAPDVLGKCSRHVEHGTMSNQGEPLHSDLIFANPVLPGAPRPRLTGPGDSPRAHPAVWSALSCADLPARSW